MQRRKNAQIRGKKHLTIPNISYGKKKKNAHIWAKKAPNPTLQKLCQEKK